MLCHGDFGGICSAQAFEEKTCTVFRHRETQFEIGAALCLDFRRLRVKQQRRIRQAKPLLRIAAQLACDVGGIFRNIHLNEDSGFYWILQVHCKADQLRGIEYFARKDGMENARQIRWITGYDPQRALVIESLETIE